MNLQHSTWYMWLWYRHSRNPSNEIPNPISSCWILTFSSVSQAIIVGQEGYAMPQVTT